MSPKFSNTFNFQLTCFVSPSNYAHVWMHRDHSDKGLSGELKTQIRLTNYVTNMLLLIKDNISLFKI